MKSHRELDVWNKAIDFSEIIYRLTKDYPREESFGLVSQMRRAAVSIAANVSEGAARNSRKDFIRFLYIARGSASELDTLLEISDRTKMTETDLIIRAKQDNVVILKMLSALIGSLSTN
ncbi:MAG: four helix bundle protein, partial [Gammaproteobacteria bacterium]